VSAENWHEERDRLARLLKASETGKVSRIDEDDLRQLPPTNPEKHRLVEKTTGGAERSLG
jgi:hypothetical protein